MKFLKAIFAGLPVITLKVFGDIALAIFGRIAWKVILERLLTRVLVGALDWLASLSSNAIYQDTVIDVLNDFEGRGLAKVKSYEARRIKRDNKSD